MSCHILILSCVYIQTMSSKKKTSPKVSSKFEAAEKLKKDLAQKNIEVTAENLKKYQKDNGVVALKPLLNSLSCQLKRKDSLDDYKSLNELDRWSHIARFVLDPSSGGLTAKNTTEVVHRERDSRKYAEFTMKQLGSERWLNCMDHAKAECKKLERIAEAPSSTPENPVRVYKY